MHESHRRNQMNASPSPSHSRPNSLISHEGLCEPHHDSEDESGWCQQHGFLMLLVSGSPSSNKIVMEAIIIIIIIIRVFWDSREMSSNILGCPTACVSE
jgi:hypothetical protein